VNWLARARLARAAFGDIRVPVTRLPPYGGRTIVLREGAEPPARAVCAPHFPGRGIRLCMQRVAPVRAAVSSASDICRLMRGTASADRESFYAIHTNVRNQPIGIEEVSRGTLYSTEVHPREVFKSAILDNAAAVIFAHNHPSGLADPSREDIELTARLKDAGDILGIKVLDHVIVAGNNCVSFRDRGML
jgi:DNA repair protein RadC